MFIIQLSAFKKYLPTSNYVKKLCYFDNRIWKHNNQQHLKHVFLIQLYFLVVYFIFIIFFLGFFKCILIGFLIKLVLGFFFVNFYFRYGENNDCKTRFVNTAKITQICFQVITHFLNIYRQLLLNFEYFVSILTSLRYKKSREFFNYPIYFQKKTDLLNKNMY